MHRVAVFLQGTLGANGRQGERVSIELDDNCVITFEVDPEGTTWIETTPAMSRLLREYFGAPQLPRAAQRSLSTVDHGYGQRPAARPIAVYGVFKT